jgi:hypothetical protein
MNSQKKQVQEFVAAIKENGRKCWNEPEDESFINQLVHVHPESDGSITICDNFERFFSSIYRVDRQGNWYIRTMFSGEPEREYSFEKAMSDASIMYTG